MRLRNDVARELPSPVVVVALRAREVELALAPVERRAAGGEERPHPRGDRDVDRQAARLARDERGEREQLPALVGERGRDRKSTRLNSSHRCISYAVFCL